jgi:hypothetical protein
MPDRCVAALVPQAAIDAAVLAASKPIHDDGHTDCYYAGILLAAWPHLAPVSPAVEEPERQMYKKKKPDGPPKPWDHLGWQGDQPTIDDLPSSAGSVVEEPAIEVGPAATARYIAGLEAEVERLREALQSIAGKRKGTAAFCRAVAAAALAGSPSQETK